MQRNSLTLSILKIVGAAAVAGVAVLTFAALPGLAVVARELMADDPEERRRLRRQRQQQISTAIRRLRERRMVRLEERGGEHYLVITKAGKEEVRKFTASEVTIVPPARWDGRWRVITFDIPEQRKLGREALRQRLRTLGCYPLQKSVFVIPYECREEIEFLAHFCEVGRCVEYLTCDDLGQSEIRARRHFGLLLNSKA